MEIIIRAYQEADLPSMTEIWNTIVTAGRAFPQQNPMTQTQAAVFFKSQSYTAVAEVDGRIVGLYILHPNNVGRCGHIANASYGVTPNAQGKGVGRKLIQDSLEQAQRLEFHILQFNAVVASNHSAIKLYESIGFQRLGTIPGGFYNKDQVYEDIILFYYLLGK